MIFFIYLTFISLLVLSLIYRKNIISVSIYLNLVTVLLLALIFLKDGSIIPDYQVYKDLYNTIVSGNYNILIEPSYILISLICSKFGNLGFQCLLLIYGFISLRLIFKTLLLSYRNIDYAVLLYFSNAFIIFNIVQIRAGIALCFIYLAILSSKTIKSYIIYMLTAVFFHYSSIIFFPLIFLKKLKLNNLTILILFFASYFCSTFFKEIFLLVLEIIPDSDIATKLLTYTYESRADLFSINLLNPFILSKILLLFILLFFRKKMITINGNSNLLLKMYFFAIFIYISFSSFPEISVRLSNILFVSEIILITILINLFKQQRFVQFSLIMFCFFMLFYNVQYNSYFNYSL